MMEKYLVWLPPFSEEVPKRQFLSSLEFVLPGRERIRAASGKVYGTESLCSGGQAVSH